MIRSFLYNLPLLIAILTLVTATRLAAQTTGQWITVDSQHVGRMNTIPNQIAASDRGDYVVVTQEDATVGPYTIRHTTDAGTSWVVVRADSGRYWNISDIAHPTKETIFVIGDTADSFGPIDNPIMVRHPFVLRSTDAGITWDRTALSDSFTVKSIAMFDAGNGAILTSRYDAALKFNRYRLHVTSDGGTTWTVRAIPPTGASMGRIASRDPHGYVIPAYEPATQSSVLYLTTDDGVQWETHPMPAGIVAIDFVNALAGWGAGGKPGGQGNQQRDVIARTTDGGQTWTTVIDSLINFKFGLSDIRFADANHGIAVGGYAKILRTTDGGTSWHQDWPSSNLIAGYAGFYRIAYPVADEALATTSRSAVLRYTGRQKLSAPTLTSPGENSAELPLEFVASWTKVEGALWYDFQVGDTTYDFFNVEPRIFDVPFIDARGITDTSRGMQLSPNTRYVFRVRAGNATDTSDWSIQLWTLSRKAGQTLVAPHFTLPVAGSSNVPLPVHLEWTSVPGATGYDLQVADNPLFQGPSLVTVSNHPVNSYDAEGLKTNTMYYAIVRARNANEEGNWSNINDGKHTFTTAGVSGMSEASSGTATRFTIGPNPLQLGQGELRIDLAKGGSVVVRLLDVAGRSLGVLFNGALDRGEHRLALDMSAHPAGIYFVRLEQAGASIVAPIVIAR